MGFGVGNVWPEWVRKLHRWWTTAPCQDAGDHDEDWSGHVPCNGRVRVVRGTRASIYCDRCLTSLGLPPVSKLEGG